MPVGEASPRPRDSDQQNRETVGLRRDFEAGVKAGNFVERISGHLLYRHGHPADSRHFFDLMAAALTDQTPFSELYGGFQRSARCAGQRNQ